MTTIRITELERNTNPSKTDLLATDNTTTGTRASTIEEAVNSVVKKANNQEAVTGTDNTKFMTPESTKAAIDGLSVPQTRVISTTSDLTGGGPLSGNLNIGLSPSAIANLAKANTSVQPEQLELKLDKPSGGTSGDLIRGDGSLIASNTFATAAQGALADTAVQPAQLTAYALKSENDLKLDKPVGGTANNIIKGDGTVVGLETFATADQGIKADNALLFTGQTRTDAEKSQARNNIGTDYLNPYRNKVINGGFVVAQRGEGPFTNFYTVDQWKMGVGSGASCTVKRVVTPFSDLASNKVPSDNTWHIEWERTASGTSESVFGTRIENVRTLSGKKATVTFYAKSLIATSITPKLEQNFGVGGTPSSPVYVSFPKINLTTEWQKFSLVVDVPSLAGKQIETSNYLHLYFGWANTDPNTTIAIARVSLVEGDATLEDDPFSMRHIQQEIDLCYRYYRKIRQTYSGNVTNGFTSFNRTILYPPMRVSPTASAGVITNSGFSTTVRTAAASQETCIIGLDGTNTQGSGEFTVDTTLSAEL